MATSTLTVTRASTSQIGNPLTVNFSVGGTATFGTDYTVSGATTFTTTSGSIIIPANQTTASLVLTTTPDAVIEPNETVIITLIPTNGVSSGTGSATYTITNDDVSTTVLLLHFNETNGSIDPIDSSVSPTTVSRFGAITTPFSAVSTLSFKFGTASLKLSNGGFSTGSSVAKLADIVQGDLTIEAWVRIGAAASSSRIFSCSGLTLNYVSGNLIARVNSGTTSDIVIPNTGSLGFNTTSFYHIAVTKQGNVYRLFTEGTLRNTQTNSVAIASNNGYADIGDNQNNTLLNFFVDELRITKGAALYTANFIPPTAAFTS